VSSLWRGRTRAHLRLRGNLARTGFEEIAVIRRIAARETAAAEFEARIPVWRRTKILPAFEVGAQLIVSRALLRILQHLIGLAQFLEADLGVGHLADIG